MKMLVPYIFNKNELKDKFENQKQLDNWILNKIKRNQIKKVRNGLYVSLDQAGIISSNKFEIASKISDTTFLAYHSALEYYGLSNQVFNTLFVCSSHKFNDFEFENIQYIFKSNNNYTEVNNIVSENIRVTSLERTIIDCIDKIDIAGGIDEILHALDQIKYLREEKLLDVLNSYNQVLLYQKVGYVLESYKEQLNLSKDFFEKCKEHLTNQTKYFLQDEYDDIKYNSTWKLMAPRNIKSRLYGGY